jgi:hypothetical protein
MVAPPPSKMRRKEERTMAKWRNLWPVLIFVFLHLHVLVCAGKAMAATKSWRQKEQQTVRVFKQGVFFSFISFCIQYGVTGNSPISFVRYSDRIVVSSY